jgi:predicted 3-demethylubiquinone-9 3-methyltransferase (glyoxalase superfamily)
MQKITPFLWFNDNAEEAVKFYTSIFKKSKIVTVTRYEKSGAKASNRKEGSVMTIAFELNGQKFVALNGGPLFPFTEAVSFVVNCKTQAEIGNYWKKLSAGGKESQCGWLKDKFGLSWQIVPANIGKLLSSKDEARTQRVMQAVMQMQKLDIKTLKKAFSAKSV